MELAAILFFAVMFLAAAICVCSWAMGSPPGYKPATAQAHHGSQITVTPPVTRSNSTALALSEPADEPVIEKKEVLYDVPMNDELQRFVRERCEENGVPFEIAIALIGCESGYQTDALSVTDDYGLMQINSCNHEWLAEELGLDDMMDPYQNITAGTYILGMAFKKYGDPHQALMAYNMGDNGMSRVWAEGHRSSAYSRAVMEAAKELKER